MKHGPWSEEDFARAKQLRTQGMSYRKIGLELHRTLDSVTNKLNHATGRGRTHFENIYPVKPSELALAERDRRLAIQHTEITAMLMGDPLPGFSQLDRRYQMKRGFR